MALHRFRIDGIDSEPLVEEGADERARRGLERDQDIVRRLSPRRTMFMNCSNPSAVCSIVPVDSTVPTSSIKYTCSLSAQSIPTNSTCSPPVVCVVTTRGITNSLLSHRRSRRVFLSVVVCRAILGER